MTSNQTKASQKRSRAKKNGVQAKLKTSWMGNDESAAKWDDDGESDTPDFAESC